MIFSYHFLPISMLEEPDYFAFLEEEKEWLKDYTTFMAIKEDRHGQPWSQWPQELRNHTSDEVKEEAYRLRERVVFYERIQYLFSKQIKALKKMQMKMASKSLEIFHFILRVILVMYGYRVNSFCWMKQPIQFNMSVVCQ